MRCNVGGADRIARIIVGAILLIVGFTVSMPAFWQAIVFILAAVALITAFVRYCPANQMLGLNTCRPRGQGGQRG